MIFDDSDYEILDYCPWCHSSKYEKWGALVNNFETVKCLNCELIFIIKRLNESGLNKYYTNYLSHTHQADISMNKKRQRMYEIEFDLIKRFAKPTNVLDVGCSGGYFLDFFQKHGFECFGFEIGQEALEEASKKYKVWTGNFEEISIPMHFDLIILRGVIEHIPYPKKYLKKATELINEGGLIYITSTPNAKAFCCSLFKENWNQHAPEGHLMHMNTNHFDDFFLALGFEKINDCCLYEKSPYANVEDDILAVAKAIDLKKKNKKINFKSPPFYGNMLSLIYKKQVPSQKEVG